MNIRKLIMSIAIALVSVLLLGGFCVSLRWIFYKGGPIIASLSVLGIIGVIIAVAVYASLEG
jgi:hypothetical protein